MAAAERLMSDLSISPEDIDLVVFISQTPGYVLPATSCVIHERLGLPIACAAFDVNLGCSGYTYGVWMAGTLMAGSGARRALLLAGDTVSKICNPADRSVLPVFGDAGTATILESDPEAPEMAFAAGTDGRGAERLIVPAGGFRKRSPDEAEAEAVRTEADLYMDGNEIFAFTIREVPRLIEQVHAESGWTIDDVDHYVFHQANDFMLDHLRRRMKVPAEKFVRGLRLYGNTSSASIPLAMTTELRAQLTSEPKNLVLAGFGVGFSWAAIGLTCGPTVISPLVEVGDDGKVIA